MELIGRMMDGSIRSDPVGRLEPVSSGLGAKQEDKTERLKGVPLFEGCSRRQLRRVAKIARVFDVAVDTVLTRAGEPGGEFFGEMSLLDGGPRSATVVADTPLRLVVISRRNFSVLLKEVPGLIQTLLMTLSRRVRKAEEQTERLRFGSTGR